MNRFFAMRCGTTFIISIVQQTTLSRSLEKPFLRVNKLSWICEGPQRSKSKMNSIRQIFDRANFIFLWEPFRFRITHQQISNGERERERNSRHTFIPLVRSLFRFHFTFLFHFYFKFCVRHKKYSINSIRNTRLFLCMARNILPLFHAIHHIVTHSKAHRQMSLFSLI